MRERDWKFMCLDSTGKIPFASTKHLLQWILTMHHYRTDIFHSKPVTAGGSTFFF